MELMSTGYVRFTLRRTSQPLLVNLGAVASCRVCRYSFEKTTLEINLVITEVLILF